ncbi:MAG TPA: KR domain-containing protein, partial [Ktedonobacteraceae bacterium]|nr:KR domain-containing protein [Ktedonobacteraceae bacterium]
HAPEIPYISDVTGTWITDEQATDPAYWAEHMCRTVQFADGVARLLTNPDLLLLEVGPGQALCSFVKQHPDCGRERLPLIMPALPAAYDRQSHQAFLLTTLGKLWLAGVTLDWPGFYEHEQRSRLPLPTYPFEHQRYWIEAKKRPVRTKQSAQTEQKELDASTATIGIDSELERIPDITDWFFLPSWKRTLPPSLFTPTDFWAETHCWLVFVDTHDIAYQLVNDLRQRGQQVVTVTPGPAFSKRGENAYTVSVSRRSDYESLLKELRSRGTLPAHVVHAWTVTRPGELGLDEALDKGFNSLLTLAQVLGDAGLEHPCDISILSNEIQRVLGNEQLCPGKATVIGPTRVIPQEYANLRCRSIDIAIDEAGTPQEELLQARLLDELASEPHDAIIALRDGQRWVQSFEPVPLDGKGRHAPHLREGGVYLITGGLGGIGLAMAESLARATRARLVLTGRSGLPAREEWSSILETQGDTHGAGRQIRLVQAIEQQGSEVLVLAADVTSETSMRAVIEQTLERFGALHGVLHTAAVPGVGLMQLKTPEMAYQVLAPKITGTLVLERVLENISLDFLALFSSMTSTTGGGPGQVDYCAANAFLDAYASQHTARHGITLAIDWGEWQWNAWEEGLSGYDSAAQTFFRAHRQVYGITFEEGTEAFKRILSYALPLVVVSTQDFRAIAELSKQFTAASILQRTQEARQNQEMHPRPDLSSSYAEPRNELEQQIASIWEDLLGISPVGIEDNFFELGGNSLTGVDLMARLRRALSLEELAAHILYEAPTVSALAAFVERG